MLAIPPKMKAALDAGTFEPVEMVKVTTSVLDAPRSTQTYVDVNSNLANIATKRDIEQVYPDPSLASPLNALGQGTDFPGGRMIFDPGGYISHTGILVRLSEAQGGHDPVIPYVLQTFSIDEDIQFASKLKSITIKLRAESRIGSQAGQVVLKGRLYKVKDGDLIDFNVPEFVNQAFGGGVESSTTFDIHTIPLAPASPTDHEFIFDFILEAGAQYAFVLVYQAIGDDIPQFSIKWSGQNKRINHSERSGPGDLNIELYLKANFYQYDSSPVPLLQVQFDLGEVPTANGAWSIQDTPAAMIDAITGLRQETSVSYHAWAGDSLGAKTLDLGVIDPSSISSITISTLKRYYILEVTFTSTTNGLRTHQFNGANPIFPKEQIVVSSGKIPFADVSALHNVSSISTELDVRGRITKRGTYSFEIIDLGGLINRYLIQSNLLNLPIEYRLGHRPDASSENDLLLLFSGKVTDFQFTHGLITLAAEDYTTNLNQKIPKTNKIKIDTSKIRRTFKGDTLINAMKKIIRSEVGILPRYIRTSTFDSLETNIKASDTTTLWITHRELKEEVEAASEVKDILDLVGAYLLAQEDGILEIVQFPRLDTSVATWDEDVLALGDVQKSGLPKSIINQCFVKYDLHMDGKFSGTGGDIDIDAQDDWAPGAESHVADRVIKTKYLGNEETYHGETIALRVAKREVKHKKNGIIPYGCKTALNEIGVQVGEYVDVTTPVYIKKGELGAVGTQFMAIKKQIHVKGGFISWALIEAVAIDKLPTAAFTASPISGSPTLNVTVNGSASHDNNSGGSIVTWEWDKDYDGANFTVDATGVTPAAFPYDSTATGFKIIALRVTSALGGQHIATKIIRVVSAPVPVINYSISAPDQPLSVVLSSGSYGVTGGISLVEWDLSYVAGEGFNAEVVGNSTTLNLPYQSITVAIRVTDEDGQTAIGTRIFSGKAFPPANVTGFFVDQVGDKLVFHWDNNTDKDIKGYEIRWGSSWTSSVEIGSEIQTNSFTTVAPTVPGSKTYLISAINTSGRYSFVATAITITIFDLKNRNVIVTKDYQSDGWPGTIIGLIREAATNNLWIGSTDDLVSGATELVSAATGVLGLRGTRVSGTFEGDPIDLGAIISGIRLSIETGSVIIPDPIGTSFLTEYSESDDGVVYTPFSQVSQSDKDYRFTKPKITLTNDDGASNIGISALATISDVPDIIDSREDEIIPVGGKVVSYNRVFNNIPGVTSIAIQNMTVALYLKLTSKTKTGCTMQIFRASDNVDVGATIDWGVKGY